jgi:flavin reductase (DIM6/NTAB) family NADH-FMN oxidoreductase RutF
LAVLRQDTEPTTEIQLHYDTKTKDHGMKHDPFKAVVVPRPIGWISSVSPEGILNLAPYSFFNIVSDEPHMVMFSSGGRKDTQRNIEASGEFTCSLVTDALRENMNMSSAAVSPDVDEFNLAGVTPAPSVYVKSPRVAESPVALECKLWKTVSLPPPHGQTESFWTVMFGLVVGVYIDDQYIRDGRVDTVALRPVSRLGYMDYSVVTPESIFRINRPTVGPDGHEAKVEDKPWDGVYR